MNSHSNNSVNIPEFHLLLVILSQRQRTIRALLGNIKDRCRRAARRTVLHINSGYTNDYRFVFDHYTWSNPKCTYYATHTWEPRRRWRRRFLNRPPRTNITFISRRTHKSIVLLITDCNFQLQSCLERPKIFINTLLDANNFYSAKLTQFSCECDHRAWRSMSDCYKSASE